jgi:probable HAF family extracellular repeat protein
MAHAGRGKETAASAGSSSRGKRSFLLLAALAFLVSTRAMAQQFAGHYAITDLGRVDLVWGMNNNGQVVGGNTLGHAFLWSSSTGATDLGTLNGSGTTAYGINQQGQVVGGTGSAQAFIWSGGQMTNLNSLVTGNPGVTLNSARAINAAGQIVGQADDPEGGYPFLFNSSGGTLIVPSGFYAYDIANSVNASGEFAGDGPPSDTNPYDEFIEAYICNGTSVTWLGTLGGANSYAMGINDAGEVVGYADNSETNYHAFLWSASFPEGAQMEDLGTLGSAQSSYAYAINNQGQIVGYCPTNNSYTSEYYGRAIGIAFPYRNMIDLNNVIAPSSGWVLQAATAINDNGQIAGIGVIGLSSGTHGFLLTPWSIHVRYPLAGLANYLALYWPSNALEQPALESNATLNGTNWVTVTNRPVFTNGVFQVVLPMTNSACFYQLGF